MAKSNTKTVEITRRTDLTIIPAIIEKKTSCALYSPLSGLKKVFKSSGMDNIYIK